MIFKTIREYFIILFGRVYDDEVEAWSKNLRNTPTERMGMVLAS